MRKSVLFLSTLTLTSFLWGCNESAVVSMDVIVCVPACANNIAIICDKDGTKHEENCAQGCDGSVCKSSPQMPECVPACANNIAIICDKDGTKHEENCAQGCDGSVCKSGPQMPECVPGCNDDKLTTCDNDGAKQVIACALGCDGEQCRTSNGCKDELCANGGSCDRGICVNEAMKNMDLANLSPAVQDYCVKDQLFHSDEFGHMTVTDCSQHGGCILYELNNEITDESYLKGRCREDYADRCTHAGMDIIVCEENDDGAFTQTCTCRADTEGRLFADCPEQPKDCPVNHCNADKTGCDIHYECKKDDYGDYFVATTGNQIVDAKRCSHSNSLEECFEHDNIASCETPCDPVQMPKPEYSCPLGNWLFTTQCVSDDNGHYFRKETTQSCADCTDLICHASVSQTHPEKACNWNTFVPSIEDGKISLCENAEIKEVDVSRLALEAGNDKATCVILHNIPECYTPCEAEETAVTCENNASTVKSCSASTLLPEVPYMLSKKTTYCYHDCDETTHLCKTIVDDELQSCDETFVTRCDGNIHVHCFDHTVHATECGGFDETCLVGSPRGCEHKCSVQKEVSYICNYDDEGDGAALETICKKIDGVWVLADQIDRYCIDCTPDTCTAEGNLCLPEQNIDHCEGSTAVTCDPMRLKTTKQTCRSGDSCFIIDGKATCAPACEETYDHTTCANDTHITHVDMCQPDDNQNFYQVRVTDSCRICGSDLSCKNACQDNGHCIKVHENDYQICHFDRKCEGDILLMCTSPSSSDYKVQVSQDCSKKGKKCRLVKDDYQYVYMCAEP